MKKILLSFFFVLILMPVFATNIGITTDIGAVQDLVFRTNSYQFSADVRATLSEKFEVRIPVTIGFSRTTKIVDSGLMLTYHPWTDYGLFMGLSLIQFAYVQGSDSLDKKIYGLNEINIGWTFTLLKGLILEPSICIHDPSGTFEDEYSLLKGLFPCYRKFRVKLSAGWSFEINN